MLNPQLNTYSDLNYRYQENCLLPPDHWLPIGRDSSKIENQLLDRTAYLNQLIEQDQRRGHIRYQYTKLINLLNNRHVYMQLLSRLHTQTINAIASRLSSSRRLSRSDHKQAESLLRSILKTEEERKLAAEKLHPDQLTALSESLAEANLLNQIGDKLAAIYQKDQQRGNVEYVDALPTEVPPVNDSRYRNDY